ncbi:hypothetical protein [Candidatus Solirubrobacter pratensis]|uniref:hypothetical protein n=1 Tax=Candidatus Solirubrobacter pratensis TaxID=1298857 RepID=UPI001E30A562|nr:hypothetical protein [Candidatus Solirubrobacter pratensis]
MEYRDIPEPLPLRKVLGPSVILAGVGAGSGEYILWPYISSNAGIGFLYLAVVGVTGFGQPLVLLLLSACLNGIVMFVYSILLIRLNRGGLPPAIRVHGFRLGALCFAVLFYGFFAGWYVIVQMGDLV